MKNFTHLFPIPVLKIEENVFRFLTKKILLPFVVTEYYKFSSSERISASSSFLF